MPAVSDSAIDPVIVQQISELDKLRDVVWGLVTETNLDLPTVIKLLDVSLVH